MSFSLFEYSSIFLNSWRQSFFGFWFFKFTSYEGGEETHRSLLCIAAAYGQPVLEIFFIKFLSFDPVKAGWE